MTFREECIEWLQPFGYGVHSHSADNTWFLFMPINSEEDRTGPSIECGIDSSGLKYCTISGHPLKLFIQMSVKKLQFKHPDIERYLQAFRHYTYLCITNPPSLT